MLENRNAPSSLGNTASYADDAYFRVVHDRRLSGQVSGYDPDGDCITAQVVTGPSNGGLTLGSNGKFIYTPNAGYVGIDTFTYTWSNGLSSGNTATVSINVYNNAPYAYDASFSVLHDRELSGQVYGYDLDGDVPTAELVSDVEHGELTLHANGTFVYTPNPYYVDPDSFTYTWSDGLTLGNEATVDIEVCNNTPYAMGGNITILHDQVRVVEIFDYDLDLDSITMSQVNGRAVQAGQQVSLPSGARITIYEGGQFEYLPRPGWTGVDQFTYRISDNISESEEAVFQIHVTNTAPVAQNATFYVCQKSATALQLTNLYPELDSSWGAYDLDGDPLIIDIAQVPQHGRLVNCDGYLVYEPDTGVSYWPGSDWFNYRVFDGIEGSEQKTVWLHPRETLDASALPNLKITAYRPLSNSNNMYKFIGMTPVRSGHKAYIRWNNDNDDQDPHHDRWDDEVRNEDDPIPIDLDFGIEEKPAGIDFFIAKNNNNLRIWTHGFGKLPEPGGGQ